MRLSREKERVQVFNHHFVSVGPILAGQIEQNANDDPFKHIVHEQSSLSL